jgi:hypothetical protein
MFKLYTKYTMEVVRKGIGVIGGRKSLMTRGGAFKKMRGREFCTVNDSVVFLNYLM